MSRSPFAAFANAVLRFQVASGALVEDRAGNLRPGKAIVEVHAMLKQKRDPNREPRPGVDTSAIWVEGKITNVIGAVAGQELTLPSVVTPDSNCQAVWQGRGGRFFLEFTAQNPYLKTLGIDLVNKIRGYFQPGSFVVSGEPWQPTPELEEAITSNQYSDLFAASTALSALRVVIVNEFGQLAYADSSNEDHAFRVVGLLPSAVGFGESIKVLTDGSISDAAWSWQVGNPIFLGLDGNLIQAPLESGFLLQVAVPVTPTQIDFEIQEPILL